MDLAHLVVQMDLQHLGPGLHSIKGVEIDRYTDIGKQKWGSKSHTLRL